MKNTQIWKTSIELIRRHPYLWLIALIAAYGDFRAALAYNPHSTQLTFNVFVFAVITLVGEAGLIYAISQHILGKPSNFLDAVMTAVTSLLNIFVVKVLPLVLFAVVAILLILFGSIFSASLQTLDNPIIFGFIIALLGLCGAGLLIFSQVWTLFALCVVLTGNPTDFISEAWETLWGHKNQVVKLIMPFVLIDLLLITLLFVSGGITDGSIFEYTVTGELAADDSVVGGPVESGIYRSINRAINTLLATALKGRGTDLASLPLFVMDNQTIAIIVALIGLILLPLRIAVLTAAYLTFSGLSLPKDGSVERPSSMRPM